jgi:hypothetical protein
MMVDDSAERQKAAAERLAVKRRASAATQEARKKATAVVIGKGDELGKWGIPAISGFSDGCQMSFATVVSHVGGVVTLDVSATAIAWWSVLTIVNVMFHARTRSWFTWCDIGATMVRSVFSPEPTTSLIMNLKNLTTSTFGAEFFNDRLFISTYVLFQPCRTSAVISPLGVHVPLPP